MKYGHYFKTRKKSVLIISDSPQPVGVEIPVAGKSEARKICREQNIKLWNI